MRWGSIRTPSPTRGRVSLDRLFLDANVLFSAAYRQGSGLLRLWELPDAELVTSSYALEEARRNLATDEQRTRLADLMKLVDLVAEQAAPEGPPGF